MGVGGVFDAIDLAGHADRGRTLKDRLAVAVGNNRVPTGPDFEASDISPGPPLPP